MRPRLDNDYRSIVHVVGPGWRWRWEFGEGVGVPGGHGGRSTECWRTAWLLSVGVGPVRVETEPLTLDAEDLVKRCCQSE